MRQQVKNQRYAECSARFTVPSNPALKRTPLSLRRLVLR